MNAKRSTSLSLFQLLAAATIIASAGTLRADDPHGDKLTDGRVASSFTGGDNLKEALWHNTNANPEFTVDLGKAQKCVAFRIAFCGYKPADALKGEIKDKIEVLTSNDG